jgi:hypothetical protein
MSLEFAMAINPTQRVAGVVLTVSTKEGRQCIDCSDSINADTLLRTELSAQFLGVIERQGTSSSLDFAFLGHLLLHDKTGTLAGFRGLADAIDGVFKRSDDVKIATECSNLHSASWVDTDESEFVFVISGERNVEKRETSKDVRQVKRRKNATSDDVEMFEIEMRAPIEESLRKIEEYRPFVEILHTILRVFRPTKRFACIGNCNPDFVDEPLVDWSYLTENILPLLEDVERVVVETGNVDCTAGDNVVVVGVVEGKFREIEYKNYYGYCMLFEEVITRGWRAPDLKKICFPDRDWDFMFSDEESYIHLQVLLENLWFDRFERIGKIFDSWNITGSNFGVISPDSSKLCLAHRRFLLRYMGADDLGWQVWESDARRCKPLHFLDLLSTFSCMLVFLDMCEQVWDHVLPVVSSEMLERLEQEYTSAFEGVEAMYKQAVDILRFPVEDYTDKTPFREALVLTLSVPKTNICQPTDADSWN